MRSTVDQCRPLVEVKATWRRVRPTLGSAYAATATDGSPRLAATDGSTCGPGSAASRLTRRLVSASTAGAAAGTTAGANPGACAAAARAATRPGLGPAYASVVTRHRAHVTARTSRRDMTTPLL